MKDRIFSYIKRNEVVNRIYNMLEFYELVDDSFNRQSLKISIEKKLTTDIAFVETLASFFYNKSKNKNNVDLQINLVNLINDLDYLKQYLDT